MRRFSLLIALAARRRPRARGRRQRCLPDVLRLPGRPELPLRGRSAGGHRARRVDARERRPDHDQLVRRGAFASREREERPRSKVPARRRRRGHPDGEQRGHGGSRHDLGHAEVGERRQGPERGAEEHERPQATSRRRWPAAIPGATPGIRTPASSPCGTSRTSSSSSRRSSTRRGSRSRPATYAKLYQAGYSGFKAGNSKALVGIGETSPRGRDKPSPGGGAGQPFARQVRRARREGEQEAQVRRLVDASVLDRAQGEGDAEGQVAERHAREPEAARDEPRHVVRPEEHPDLDHRIRLPDAAAASRRRLLRRRRRRTRSRPSRSPRRTRA